MKIVLALVSLLLLPAFFLPSHPISAMAATPQQEPLISTTSEHQMVIKGPASPPSNQGGIDNLAEVTYHFQPDGTVYFTDLSGSNFTISSPWFQFNGSSSTIILPLTSVSYNSTTIEYQISLGQVGLNMTYQRVPDSLDLNVSYTGILSTPGLLSLRFSGKGPVQVNPHSIFYGSEGFDWSDTMGFKPQIDNQNKTVTWTIPKSFNLDPVTIDSTGVNNNCASGVVTCTTTLTTTNDNDILIVGIYGDTGGNGVKTITDGASLQYKQRASVWVMEEWIAQAPTKLSSDTITVTMNGAPSSRWGIYTVAISGTRISSPWDQSNPPIGTNSNPSCSGYPTITTTSNVGMILAIGGNNAGNALNADQGGYAMADGSANSFVIAIEYRTYSSPQANVALTFTGTLCNGGVAAWGMILDALCTGGGCNPGGLSPNPVGFTSVNVGGISLPPQLADQGVLGLMGIITAIILLSSVPTVKRKKKDSFV